MATAVARVQSHKQLAAEHDEPGSQGFAHGTRHNRGAALQGSLPDRAHYEVAQGLRNAGK